MTSILRSLLLAALLAGCAAQHPAGFVEINIVGLNDLHGNLEASRFNGKKAGGIDTLGAALQAWRKEDPELLLVGAGDLVGASPGISALWADEPTIGALNMLGMRVASVGNHEFDHGRNELLRLQKGGCASIRADRACKFSSSFDGAKFTYLAANVNDTRTNAPFIPPYQIEEVKGVKIAFIGAVVRGTPGLVGAAGIVGLQFNDEAQSINRLLPELRAKGATVFVVLVHQGGYSDTAYDKQYCSDLRGDFVDIVKALDPAIRLVISGHTHKGYTCRVGDKIVTEAELAGHLLTRIRLKVDRATGQLADIDARNVLMTPGEYPEDPALAGYLKQVRASSEVVLARPVARLGTSFVARELMPGTAESPMGQLVTDAMLYGTRKWGSQIAFLNAPAVRQPLEAGKDNVITMGQLYAALPYANELVVMNLTGEQLRIALEDQWRDPRFAPRGLLQVSEGLTYQYDLRQPVGQRIVPGSLKLHGVLVEDNSSYRVVVNDYVADGGDGFLMFMEGTNRAMTSLRDVDALFEYVIRREQDNRPAGQTAPAPRFNQVK